MADSSTMNEIYHQGADGSLGVLRASGADAFEFLQRMFSCDLRKTTSDRGIRGTLLDRKGRILSVFDLYRGDQDILMVTSGIEVDVLQSRLEAMIILEDVSLSRDQLRIAHIFGEGASTAIHSWGWDVPSEFLAVESGDDGELVFRPRCHPLGFDLIYPASEHDDMLRKVNEISKEATKEQVEKGRILLGVPKSGNEILERTLPPEVGLGDAVAYDKGCYAGQEVLARIRTYGHVNRELRAIKLEANSQDALGKMSEEPKVGDPLFSPEKPEKAAATITSVVRVEDTWSAIISVKYKLLEEGMTLAWDPDSENMLRGSLEPIFCS